MIKPLDERHPPAGIRSHVVMRALLGLDLILGFACHDVVQPVPGPAVQVDVTPATTSRLGTPPETSVTP